MSSTYTVAVGSFEGPFDLLLALIARHQVDVYDVEIARITDEYLAALRRMDEIDLEVTTEFLLVAATLVELKAARLLPVDVDPDPDELAVEARDLLYARLLDYRMFKAAAGWLREELADHAGFHPREVTLEPRYTGLRPDTPLPIGPQELAELAARVLAERPPERVDTSHVAPVRMTVREAADLVTDELARAGGRASFRDLTAGCRHRAEVIACFLAVLELYKLDHVDLDQAAAFGELVVTALVDGPAVGLADQPLGVYDGDLPAVQAVEAERA